MRVCVCVCVLHVGVLLLRKPQSPGAHVVGDGGAGIGQGGPQGGVVVDIIGLLVDRTQNLSE